MRRRFAVPVLAAGLLLTGVGSAAAVPQDVVTGYRAQMAADGEWKKLYASSDRENFPKLRVAVCAGLPDPVTHKIKITADVVKPDEQPSGNCVVGPVPPLPPERDTGRAEPPADEDFGEQVLGFYSKQELEEIEETRMMGCWHASRIVLYMSTGNMAFIDCAQPVEGEGIKIPVVGDGS
jgi:hypothetical protein